MRPLLRLLTVLALLMPVLPAAAHEVRPAYLQLQALADERYDVLWRVPARGDARLALAVELPQACAPVSPVAVAAAGTVHSQSWRIHCPGGLTGQEIAIQGLAGTITDVLVRIVDLQGGTVDMRLTPDAPSFVVPAAAGAWDLVGAYTLLGVEHILMGLDHLLFVLALLLLVRGGWRIVKTVTAFTVAHSLTLAAAVLGWLTLPAAPVEAVIALSIVFLAAEICRVASGEQPLTARRPWIVAFAFGLLHGLGFAGALTEAGLPPDAVPLALLTFNIGVEIGQLAFIAVVLPSLAALALLFDGLQRRALQVGAYAIGGLASAWMLQRLEGLV